MCSAVGSGNAVKLARLTIREFGVFSMRQRALWTQLTVLLAADVQLTCYAHTQAMLEKNASHE